jgi:hypothetical protein
VTANNSVLADAVASILAEKLCPDVLQQVYRQPNQVYSSVRNPHSIVVDVDEGQTVHELMIMSANFRIDDPLLLIKISLKIYNIRIFKSCSLIGRQTQQVVQLVRDFLYTLPGNEDGTLNAAKKTGPCAGATG